MIEIFVSFIVLLLLPNEKKERIDPEEYSGFAF